MTGISNASRPQVPQPARQPSQPSQPSRAEPAPNDLRAMKDAMANARQQMGETQGKGAGQNAGTARAGGDGKPGAFGKLSGQDSAKELPGQQPHAGVLPDRRDVASFEGSLARGGDTSAGTEPFAGIGTTVAAGTVVPMMVPNVAGPHVDPTAFAQMMADLWTRENGRGSKEVSVRFGNSAWPATGARPVRNAAGGVDIALQVGDGGRAYGDKLPGLESALSEAGVDYGNLLIENDVV